MLLPSDSLTPVAASVVGVLQSLRVKLRWCCGCDQLTTCSRFMPNCFVFVAIFRMSHFNSSLDCFILQFRVDGRDECVMGVSPDRDTMWTLGQVSRNTVNSLFNCLNFVLLAVGRTQVFLRSFYTLFDRDANRIGFARIPRSALAPVVAVFCLSGRVCSSR